MMGLKLEQNKKIKKLAGFIEKNKSSNLFFRGAIRIKNFLLKLLNNLRKKHKGAILENHNAIYFFIEKVATRTLLSVFGCARHKKLADKRDYFKKYKNYFKFAFVRNPYDRLVSCYKNKILESKTDEAINIRNNLPRGISFEEFVVRVSKIPDIRADQHIKSQSFFIEDKKTGKLLVDFLGRFESLEKDYKKICKRIGMKPKELPKKNRSKNREDYKRYYNKKTKKLVEKRYKKDLELFGYEF